MLKRSDLPRLPLDALPGLVDTKLLSQALGEVETRVTETGGDGNEERRGEEKKERGGYGAASGSSPPYLTRDRLTLSRGSPEDRSGI